MNNLEEVKEKELVELVQSIDFTKFNRRNEELRSIYYEKTINPRYRLNFTFEEIQNFLTNKGYKFAVVKGLANIKYTETDEDQKVRTKDVKTEERLGIIAVKTTWDNTMMPRNIIPHMLDSEDFELFDMYNVFIRELKSNLLK